MNLFLVNNRVLSRGASLFVFVLLAVLYSCNPTKYVPENESILDRNEIMINKENIKKTDLLPYIKQNPNKRIFGSRFYLGLYNLSNINKTKWPHNWLRQIGEEPVIFDPSAAVKTANQIRSYVSSKGYFDAVVKDSVKTEDRKTKVFYKVDLQPPYTIRNLFFEIADSTIEKLFYFDSVNCLIDRGEAYDVDILQRERSRFERYIRDRGFYGFSSEYIFFGIDSTAGKRQVDIHYRVKNSSQVDRFNRIVNVPHAVYQVKNVYIYPDYVPGVALQEGDQYVSTLDTVLYQGYYFVTSAAEKPEVRYDLILQTLYLKPGSIFNMTNTEQTQSHLLSLKVYRLVNITYNDTGDNDPLAPSKNLNCNIFLTPLTPQSFSIELEGTNSSGNLGGALNLVYQHKNLLRGAELFSTKLKGAYETLKDTNGLRSTQEYGFESSLRFPQFILPFVKTDGFIKKYNPSTAVLAAYNFMEMPLFTRRLATATFGYTWKAGNYHTHIINPLQLNFVDLGRIDPEFAQRIQSSYLAYSYRDVMILGGGYSYIFNNQKLQGSRDFWFMRINVETAGNAISIFNKYLSNNIESGDTSYMFLGQPYAQYLKTDFDLRYNFKFNEASSIVYRGFVGIGFPYGNSRAIPFEKQYFGGGANSIRAWRVRSLGPGGYLLGNREFPNQTADIKIEGNIEYRFKLFWRLEGALFVDAGNIWTYTYDPSRPYAQFSLRDINTDQKKVHAFYKDIAVGTGTGFRFDFDFVIARIDVGMKLRDPAFEAGSKWIIARRPYQLSDFALVLGIGYPF